MLGNRFTTEKGMTLVEILLSMVILLLVLMAIFPLFTQSINVTNLSNTIAENLFADQQDIEIVAATEAGVLFADGTFIPNTSFPVIFPSGTTPCPGMTVKKHQLIRFLASIPHIKAVSLYEGYSPTEAQITITGSKTHFINETDTEIEIKDKDGYTVSGYTNYDVVNTTSVTLTLPLNSDTRLTNEYSPYTITLRTGNEQVTTLLPINLPRAVAISDNQTVLVSSSGLYWAQKINTDLPNTINEIVFQGTSELNAAYLAVGNNGSIYVWPNGEAWQEINHLLTTEDLNDIICTQDLILAVGDSGKILTSANGSEWSQANSHTTANLRSIIYSPELDKFICVGDGGVVITSDDGENWQTEHTWPRLAKESLNGKNAVRFSGLGDYLKTIHAPVTGSTNRTIFMVAGPEPNSETLMAWGSPLNTVNGGQFTMRLDKGNVRIEQNAGPGTTTSFTPPTDGTPSLISCRSTSNSFNSYELSMNGSAPEKPTANVTIETASDFPLQLGSDPFTRYTGPLNYRGLVAEVLIYDRALSRNRVSAGGEEYFASEMDIVAKYLADKYSINIDPLEGESLSNLIVQATGDTLEDTEIEAADLPDGAVLWLDASELSMDNNQQVISWLDRSGKKNHSTGAALTSVACSDALILAAGTHRNLMYSDDASQWDQGASLTNSKMATEYRFDSMLYIGSKFLALANDGLTTNPPNKENGLMYSSTDGLTWSSVNWINGSNKPTLRDLDFLPSRRTIMAVGNRSTIRLSEDGTSWSSATLDPTINTSLNLTVGAIR